MSHLHVSDTLPISLANTRIGREFLNHSGNETIKWGQYIAAYERFLGPLQAGSFEFDGSRRKIKLLEIGVREGGSLQIFQRYFGENADIIGIDIDKRCSELDVAPARIRIGDQSDISFLKSVVEELGGLDVVIDDGSHLPEHQIASFQTLWPLLNIGGLYMVEDLHTSYWRSFGGGYKRSAGFIEFIKDSIDGMHGWYSRHPMTQRGRFALTEVAAITIFDSLVVFEKTRDRRPENLRFGKQRNVG